MKVHSTQRLQERLERQADAIDRVMAGYGVAAWVLRADVLPRIIVHRLALRLGVKISAVEGLDREIALALGVESVRVAPRNGTLAIEVPRRDGQNVYLSKVLRRMAHMPGCAPVLGLDETGVPLVLSLASPDVAHVLIAGTTGAGKTILARTMILSLALGNGQRAVQVGLLDPKGRAYDRLQGLPHVLFYESDAARSLARVKWLVQEMLRRDEERRSEPRIILFIDELADLMMEMGTPLQDALTRLTQRGREAGIHIVACTQKPTAQLMGALAKANFPTRVVGKVPSADVAVACAGVPATKAEVLQGRGDFVVVCAQGMFRIQAALVPEREIGKMVSSCQLSVGSGPRERESLRSQPQGDARTGAHLELDERLLDVEKGSGSVGRREEAVTPEMVAAIQEYHDDHGAWPSARWVRREFRCGNDRARRAIDVAREGREGKRVEGKETDTGDGGTTAGERVSDSVPFRLMG